MTTDRLTARARMTAYLQQAGLSTARAEANIDALLAEAVVSVPPPADRATLRAAWIDGHPQLEAIAAAVWEKCERHAAGGSGLIVDDPRNIAVAALAAVLAVLPEPADRATLLREAALNEAAAAIQDVIDADRAKFPRRSNDRAALGAARQIVLGLIDNPRRLAAGQPTETQDTRRRLTPSEHSAAWHAIEGAAGEEGADPGTVLKAVLWKLGIDAPDEHERPAVVERPDTQTPEARRCPAKHGALGRICELPLGHPGMHTGSGPNGGAVWDGDAP